MSRPTAESKSSKVASSEGLASESPGRPPSSYPRPRAMAFYSAPPGELTTLASDDHGDTWHLATTADFR